MVVNVLKGYLLSTLNIIHDINILTSRGSLRVILDIPEADV